MKIAIFDFDGTLFPQQSVPFFMKYYLEANYPKLPYIRFMGKAVVAITKYKSALAKNYGKEEFRRAAIINLTQMFNGKNQVLLEQFFEGVSAKIITQLRPSIVEEIAKCKAEGYYCILLSGCYEPILERVAQALGVDKVIGTPIEPSMYVNGKVKVKDLDVASGPRKVEKLKQVLGNQEVDWAQSTSYGDSSHDRNILELVGNPVAVHPDEELRTLASQKNWRIIE